MRSKQIPAQHADRVSRRIISSILVLAYAVTLLGIPVSIPSGNQDARPFPCQGHRCACRTADQCWEHCCCFTREQRLAWAGAHSVVPPISETEEHEELAKHHAHENENCCEKHDEHCAQTGSSAALDSVGDHGADEHRPGVRAPKCRGISKLWVTSGAVPPTVSPTLWAFDWLVLGPVLATTTSTSSIAFDPAVPPPRA